VEHLGVEPDVKDSIVDAARLYKILEEHVAFVLEGQLAGLAGLDAMLEAEQSVNLVVLKAGR
jgi:hypothetical protein